MAIVRSFVVSVLFSQSLMLFAPGAWALGPAAAAAAQSSAISGVVVDPQSAAVVRAIVRVVDAAGKEVAITLSDANGRFTFPSVTCSNCRVEASRAGFTAASAPLGAGEIKISLGLAPLRDDVVVTATLEPTPVSQTGASVTVLNAGDIEQRGTPYVADLLRATPSTTVVRTGALGNVTSVFIRAGESDYTKVLLDGMPLNEPGGTFNFGTLSSEFIERVEIVRGAHSALFGSDAMSGVIQLVSRRAPIGAVKPLFSLNAEGGTYSTFRLGGTAAGRRGGWDYMGGIAQFSTDNRVANNAFDNTAASWNAGGAIAAGWMLRATGRIEHDTVGAPGQTAFGRPDLDANFRRNDVAASAVLDHDRQRVHHRVTFGTSRSDQRSENLIDDPPYVPTFGSLVSTFGEFFDFLNASHNVLRRHRLAYLGTLDLGRLSGLAGTHSVTVGADLDAERGALETLDPATLTRTRLIEASRNNSGVVAQYEWAGPRVSLTGGVRFDHNDSFGNEASPRLLVSVQAAKTATAETRVRFSAGKGVKEPTILESFSPSLGFKGNPDLLPERSRSLDLGVEQRLFADRLRVDAVYFDTRNRDQISTATFSFSPFTATYYNIGKTRARGLELSAEGAPTAPLRIRGGYSLVASEVLETASIAGAFPPPQFVAGQWAFRRPRHSGYLEGLWSKDALSLSVLGTFVGRRTDNDFVGFAPAILEQPSYAIWRAGVRYTLPHHVDLTLDIDNLTNTDYMEPLGYLTLERTIRVGARVRF